MRRWPEGMKLVFLITLRRKIEPRSSSKASKISQLSTREASATSLTRMEKYFAYVEVTARMSWSERICKKYSSRQVTNDRSSPCSRLLSKAVSASSSSSSSARLQQQHASFAPPPPPPPWPWCAAFAATFLSRSRLNLTVESSQKLSFSDTPSSAVTISAGSRSASL